MSARDTSFWHPLPCCQIHLYQLCIPPDCDLISDYSLWTDLPPRL
jgi:hypothetical protein